jgi:arginine/ornithine N-succinyltransferase beta subunit
VRCYCEKLVAEVRGQFGNTEEGESPMLEAVTRKLVKTQQAEKT